MLRLKNYLYKLIFNLLLSIVCISSLQAQIVNIEKERIVDHDSTGIEGKVSATFNVAQNKNLLLTSDFNPHIQYKVKRHLILAVAQWEYAALNNKMVDNGGFFHMRYNYHVRKNVKLELFSQIQYNKVWNMPLRFLLGGGPRFKFLDYKKNKMYFGPLYMFEIQDVRSQGEVQYNHRLSTYFSWNLQLNSLIFLGGIIYYQPMFVNFNNFRLTGLCELNISISKRLSFDNRFGIIFDETNTTDIPDQTYRYTAGLGYKF